MMYEAVRGALAADDAQEKQHSEPRFRVRETPDWKKHAANLEAEMVARRTGEAAVRVKGAQSTNLVLREKSKIRLPETDAIIVDRLVAE
jgi:hypothetical protein